MHPYSYSKTKQDTFVISCYCRMEVQILLDARSKNLISNVKSSKLVGLSYFNLNLWSILLANSPSTSYLLLTVKNRF